MTKKIFRSIIIVAFAVLFGSIGIATSFLYEYFNNSQVERLKSELALVAQTVNETGIEYFENFDSTVFRFTVVGKDGEVRYDTEANVSDMGNHADREEIAQAFQNGRGSSARNSATLTRKTFYEAVLLENGDVLRISISQLTLGALLLEMLPAIVAIVLVAVAFALLLSQAMARKITQPLMQLDLDNPGESVSYEELTPILAKMQNQHRQIKDQMEELRRKSEEFAQIISSMNEGLVLLDEHGMVLSMNKAARKLFDVRDSADTGDFLLVDRTSKMSKAVWDALAGKHSEFTRQKNGSEYQLNINPIVSDGKVLGGVILAFDITDKAFAERNRREFTANVSHELKTPLQSIIGSAELLENGLVKPEDTKRFVGNIKNEAARLVSLINDIIRLSQLDEESAPAAESVDLYQVAQEVAEALTVPATKKEIEICLNGETCRINGIRRYLYEIIYNLCDNAIRYNHQGGKVNVDLFKENGKTVLSVRDTGIGIPAEHQSRVFERFYRVDKSHSKETGGTGLGLSIVKHAVAYHGGTIKLQSRAGEGTEITVIF